MQLHSPLIIITRRIVFTTHQKARLAHASNSSVATRMAKHASSTLSSSSSQTSCIFTSTKQQHTVSAASSTTTTTTSGGAITKLSTSFSKLYRNNPYQVLPIEISENSNNDLRRRNEQLIQGAILLCPELILSTLPKLNIDDDDDDSSCCYYWRFASPFKQNDDEEEDRLLKSDNDDDDDQQTEKWVVFISVWSTSASSSLSSKSEMTTTKIMIPLYIRPLEGGLSNLLYIVENPCTQTTATCSPTPLLPRSVLIRLHPSCEGDVVNRDYENKLLAWLSRRHHHHTAPTTTSAVTAINNVNNTNNLPVPVFYGRFLNGRVEEFYHNVRPLTCHEMAQNCKYAFDTARLLARMHCTTLQQALGDDEYNNDNNSHDDACPLLHKSLVLQCGRDAYPGDIVPRVNAWFKRLDNVLLLNKKASPSSSPDTSSAMIKDEKISLVALVCLLKEEWQWLQSQLFYHDNSRNNHSSTSTTISNTTNPTTAAAARDFCRQVVLTHMDAQSLNLLVPANEEDDNGGQVQNDINNNNSNTNAVQVDMKLIDFEYAGFNPRGADIANTFCEHCDMNNLRGKWPEEYPSLQQQEYFVRAYLDELVVLSTSTSSITTTTTSVSKHPTNDVSILQQYYSSSSISDRDKKEFLTALCHEIGRYTLVSHLSWAVWGCVQHVNRCSNSSSRSSSSTKNATSNCDCNDQIDKDDIDDDDDFDYLAYARHRMDGYRYFQERVMSNAARI